MALKQWLSHLETSVREVLQEAAMNLGFIGFLWNFQTVYKKGKVGLHLKPNYLQRSWCFKRTSWEEREHLE